MKRAFTLIELLIGVAIFALAITLLYENLAQSKKYLSFANRDYEKVSYKEKVIKLFYQDFLNADGIKSNPNDNAVIFRTSNSIFRIPHPYVGYYLAKNRLYRVESLNPLKLRLEYSDLKEARVLPIDLNLTDFGVSVDKNKNLLIYFQILNKKPEMLFIKNLKHSIK